MNISTEKLFLLFRDMRKLFPTTSIEEFGEIINQEGYWDTRTRINIQSESVNELRKMWYGKGISQIKELWNLFRSNQFYKVVDKDIRQIARKYKSQ
jgi:hypothetical protein|tara:strand:- start:208 stop:495 length:288 start_codon:yes stop_codon:yes gene_type:complete